MRRCNTLHSAYYTSPFAFHLLIDLFLTFSIPFYFIFTFFLSAVEKGWRGKMGNVVEGCVV